ELEENDDCFTYDGSKGKCYPITSCISYYKPLLPKVKPKVCSWDGDTPQVCCPLVKKPSLEQTLRTLKPEKVSNEHTSEVLPDLHRFSPNILRCGTRKNGASFYIVGGNIAYQAKWPWIASIMIKRGESEFEHICGGNIISDFFILTAAHCFPQNADATKFMVGIGDNRLENTTKFQVEQIYTHPNYTSRLHYNDIALVQLEYGIRFTDTIRPICLPFSKDGKIEATFGDEASIAGWGHESYGGQTTNLLREASVNLISLDQCNKSYARLKSSKLTNGVTEKFICAGTEDGSRDSCSGDSGGPLVIKSNFSSSAETDSNFDGTYYQIGVISFGYQCALKDFPGVYTKVDSYLDWILSHVDLSESLTPPIIEL
ncbi:Clotting factor B-like protein, partial [Dinothrombium tinctorium]